MHDSCHWLFSTGNLWFPLPHTMALLKLLLPLFACALAFTGLFGAELPPDVESAWKHLKSANPLPHLPQEWEKNPPADQDLVRQTLRAETERLLTLADQARQFAAKYPDDPRRAGAVQIAAHALVSATRIGSPTARTQLAELDRERLADPMLPTSKRLEIRMRQLQSEAEALAQTSPADARDKYEDGARSLIAEFPKDPAPWAMLLEVVDQGNDDPTRAKLSQIVKSNDAPAPIKERAAAILHRYEALGKPLALNFTALDGRTVDLAALRGKVVVIHFWATWCTTCIDAIVTMTKAYGTLRELGVEMIGVTLDSEQAKVEQFVKEKGVAWPQFFEPSGKSNRIVRDWGVTVLPSMWLVDRNGVLRDLNAQVDLSKKIEKMLAEPVTP